MNVNKTKKALVAMAFAAAVSLPAEAVTIIGTDFDISYNPADFTFFNEPTLSGNVISLLPLNFVSESKKSVGPIAHDAADTVNFRIIPKKGQQLSKLELFEFGDYRVREEDGDDTAGATVAGLFAAANPFIANSYTSDLLETDYDSTSMAIDASAIEDNSVHKWVATSSLDQGSVNDDPFSNEANWFTGAETVVTVQNKLDTYALGNILETAYVEKKNATVDIVVSTVPVPAAAWLMMTGLGFLTMRKKGLATK